MLNENVSASRPYISNLKASVKKKKKKSHPQSQKVLDILRSARMEDIAGHKAPPLQERLQEAQEEDEQSTSL